MREGLRICARRFRHFPAHDCWENSKAVLIDMENSSLLRSAPRLMQILRVLARHKFLGALRGKNHWPPPKEVRETFEELGLTFLKFGQVLAMRRDLLPDAYINELEQLHDQLPALGIDAGWASRGRR
jgi:ubiquinone biosynthesis protein